MKKTVAAVIAAAGALAFLLPALATPPRPTNTPKGDTPSPKIAWIGNLKDGLAEAKRTNRPILLVSGAPHCHGVSGVW